MVNRLESRRNRRDPSKVLPNTPSTDSVSRSSGSVAYHGFDELQVNLGSGRLFAADPLDLFEHVAFHQIENLFGGAGDDRFRFTRDGVRLTGSIGGGPGTETIDGPGLP